LQAAGQGLQSTRGNVVVFDGGFHWVLPGTLHHRMFNHCPGRDGAGILIL
jgi:hypothetical protein